MAHKRNITFVGIHQKKGTINFFFVRFVTIKCEQLKKLNKSEKNIIITTVIILCIRKKLLLPFSVSI